MFYIINNVIFHDYNKALAYGFTLRLKYNKNFQIKQVNKEVFYGRN